jgi:hypothetical protein
MFPAPSHTRTVGSFVGSPRRLLNDRNLSPLHPLPPLGLAGWSLYVRPALYDCLVGQVPKGVKPFGPLRAVLIVREIGHALKGVVSDGTGLEVDTGGL